MVKDATARARADAARNRAKILTTARDAFANGESTITFGALARRADVSVGMLYRNFAHRQALVEAVYQSEIDELLTMAQAADDTPADVALREWIDRYATFVATKRVMAEAFSQAVASGAMAATHTRVQVRQALGYFLARGRIDGTLRTDLDADDVAVALVATFFGVAQLAVDADQRARVIDILVAGLRP